ncbi:selenouridine synthase SelU-like subunit [Methanothermococcus thermolithotrophicus]|uniref:selenouridine synthase SelU-like subunit n=1 Tax=Methanothermococcus thermolithotrophicus TaxID=2186 RepID=UPI00036FDA2F|nr:selenouridine synthase SelU-like subunit [Methanothermococcus thermolithotrophicus]MDK2988331.1 tRNA 2-selenouridine synthase [Methanothermococcus sp.]
MIIFGLFGKTGCGKTEILQELKKFHPVVDIEACGNTRGSVLGDLYNLKQRSQEEFDHLLNKQYEKAKKAGYCVTEFEGRKIGGAKKLIIPGPFSNIKSYNYKIVIDCPYHCQIKRLLKYYLPNNEKEKEILLSKFILLKNSLRRKDALEALDRIIELVNNDEYYEAAVIVEEKLYRQHYLRHIKKIEPDLVIYNENTLESADVVNNFINEKLKKHGLKN